MQAFEARLPPLTNGPDGVIRVAGTRVSLETVVYAFDAGSSAEEIVEQYPSLSLSNVYAVISYALDNRQSVDEYVHWGLSEGSWREGRSSSSAGVLLGPRLRSTTDSQLLRNLHEVAQ